jgi:hypothetical protein
VIIIIIIIIITTTINNIIIISINIISTSTGARILGSSLIASPCRPPLAAIEGVVHVIVLVLDYSTTIFKYSILRGFFQLAVHTTFVACHDHVPTVDVNL